MTGGDRPSISVVIPAYNAARFIAATLESVLAQSYPVSECIVVDDGSVDSTADIVGEFEARVTLVSQTNQGLAAARNRGVREATSKLIAFCDADDVWRKDKLELQVQALAEDPGVSAVFCGVVIVDAELEPLDELPTPEFPLVGSRVNSPSSGRRGSARGGIYPLGAPRHTDRSGIVRRDVLRCRRLGLGGPP